MRALELSILDEPLTPPVERPEDPRLELPVVPPPVDIETPEDLPLPPGPGEPEARPDAIERLQPRVGDPRLWTRRDGVQPEVEPNRVDQLRARVYGRLEALNDSLIAIAEAERRSKDWSYVTEDGKRWGISSEGIHLGSITLPAPNFAPTPGRRDEINRLVRTWHELSRQAEMAGIREDFDARVREIRERRDAERREKAANGRDP